MSENTGKDVQRCGSFPFLILRFIRLALNWPWDWRQVLMKALPGVPWQALGVGLLEIADFSKLLTPRSLQILPKFRYTFGNSGKPHSASHLRLLG